MKQYNRIISITVLMLISVVIISSTGCNLLADSDNDEVTLTIGAASDLYYAFNEAGEVFEDNHNIKLDFSFGSTGLIHQQVSEGAPMDLYAAADEKHVYDLIEEGLVNEEDHALYATGLIVIATPEGDIKTIEELTKEEVELVSIANPEHAPYGRAAKQAIESEGLWEELEPKLVIGSNIRDAQRYLERGEVDASILALSLVEGVEQDKEYHLIDDELHEPLNQRMAVINTSMHIDESRKFLEFITESEEGRNIMESYGFLLP